jgi:hypothetical protein
LLVRIHPTEVEQTGVLRGVLDSVDYYSVLLLVRQISTGTEKLLRQDLRPSSGSLGVFTAMPV